MKKQLILVLIFVFSLASFAQVGIGTTDPKTTLQIDKSAIATDADGVLVPRVTVAELNTKAAAYVAAQNGALVFVTDISGVTGKTSDVTAIGFHYYNHATTKWVAVGGGGAASNIYTANGTLTGARTVTQDNNNLTFTTGTARTIVDGKFQTIGAIYGSITSSADNPLAPSSWIGSTEILLFTAAATGQIRLPDATSNSGRRLVIINGTTGPRNWDTSGTAGLNTPIGVTAIASNRAQQVISDGTSWRYLN